MNKKKQNEIVTITEDVDMLYKAVIKIYDTYRETQNQNFIVNIVMHNSKNCMKNLQLFAEIMHDFNTDLKINTQVQLINA